MQHGDACTPYRRVRGATLHEHKDVIARETCVRQSVIAPKPQVERTWRKHTRSTETWRTRHSCKSGMHTRDTEEQRMPPCTGTRARVRRIHA
eukprot:6004951-Alexandrium_andersonii.AAC.1